MTKYEELDIENMTQADIRNIILEGDRISIEVEGVEGVLVRTVEQCLNGLRVKLYGVAIIQIRHFSDYGIGMTVTRIERPIPKVVLPTVPGYYERVRFPISRGYFAIRLDEHGKWHREGMRVTKEQLRVSYLPLTRLVPETATAKLVDRLDLKLVGALMDNISERDYATYQENGAVLIAAIDNGELDK